MLFSQTKLVLHTLVVKQRWLCMTVVCISTHRTKKASPKLRTNFFKRPLRWLAVVYIVVAACNTRCRFFLFSFFKGMRVMVSILCIYIYRCGIYLKQYSIYKCAAGRQWDSYSWPTSVSLHEGRRAGRKIDRKTKTSRAHTCTNQAVGRRRLFLPGPARTVISCYRVF